MDQRGGQLPPIPTGSMLSGRGEGPNAGSNAKSQVQQETRASHETSSEEVDIMIERSRLYEESLRKLKDVIAAQEAYRKAVQASQGPHSRGRNRRSNRPWSFAPNEARATEDISRDGARVEILDPEKGVAGLSYTEEAGIIDDAPSDDSNGDRTLWQRLHRFLITNVLEKRGIERVEPHERHDLSSFGLNQMTIFWFGMNLAANNITLGMLGPVVYGLGFLDSCMCAIFGMLLGSLPAAWVAITGPKSGLRTLIWSRYTMGWHPVKVVVIFNILGLLGYSMIDALIAGQMLSAVSPHGSLTVVVGIIIVSLITVVITSFGYSIFHYYERYAWGPQLVALCILAGVAGPDFNVNLQSVGSPATKIGNRISFFSLCLSAAITYAGCSGSFFVYYPSTMKSWKIFWTAMVGLLLSFAFTFILGIGLAAGTVRKPSWAAAYKVSQGALIVEGFAPLGAFGSFLSVIVALGLISNVIPTAYACAIDFQMLGRHWNRVPRVAWNTIGIVVFTICAAAGRENLAEIFTNFLAIMGYWCSIWVALILEETFIFRRRAKPQIVEPAMADARTEPIDHGFDWTVWNKREYLPLGIAASIAFAVGWVGAILCMAQLWYVGPIAKMIGDYGGDLGNYVGFAIAALIYPPLRWLELKRFRR